MKKEIIMYGADWCSDTLRSKKILEDNNIEYTFLDVEDATQGKEYSQIVMDLNEGKRIVPTLIIDNEQFTNPTPQQLQKILNLDPLKIININSNICPIDSFDDSDLF